MLEILKLVNHNCKKNKINDFGRKITKILAFVPKIGYNINSIKRLEEWEQIPLLNFEKRKGKKYWQMLKKK